MRILHLSDIHFGTRLVDGKPEPVHWLTDASTGLEDTGKLIEILSTSQAIGNPEVVVVSGDLTWQGAEAEYKSALEFLVRVRASWPQAAVLVVPGNHDVNVATEVASETRQDGFLQMMKQFYGSEFDKRYPLLDSASNSRRQDLVSVVAVGNEILLIGINSAASLEQKNDPVVVSPTALAKIGAQLKTVDPDRRLVRILVLHHHLFPFVEPDWTASADPNSVADRVDTSLVANSAKLQEWLSEHAFSIILHGHKHAFHARIDRLWREGGSADSEVVVIGGGSAGVYWKKLGKERRHTCNIVDIERAAESRWRVEIDTKLITLDGAIPSIRPLMTRECTIGREAAAPWTFQSDDMQLVHRAIMRRCEGKGAIRNFMSLVELAEYRHPDSLRLGDRPATQQDVERSFAALHPEWTSELGWFDDDILDKNLIAQSQSYRIQHGSRMFGRLEHFDLLPPNETSTLRPIFSAIAALKDSRTRGYVGLYNPELDVLSKRHLLPGLVGLQFLPDRQRNVLDVVAMFRNLELSFWWAVNMFELVKVMTWAIARIEDHVYKPGSVSMFASSAEWLEDPRPVFLAKIDVMPAEDVLALLLLLRDGDSASRITLRNMLLEKSELTTVLNIDVAGLKALGNLSRGIVKLRDQGEVVPFSQEFVHCLEEATKVLYEAIELKKPRSEAVQRARVQLDKAAAMLGTS